MSFEAALKTAMQGLGMDCPERFAADCRMYFDRMVAYNEKVNLTAITDPEEAAVKHFADSAALVRFAEIAPDASLIDVGTGAGFPSLPAALLRRDLRVTLLDSLQKRLTFLEELCAALSLDAVTVHARAEDAGHDPALRERFDIATARAVASLPVLAEYCLPLVRVGGSFVALKGADAPREVEESRAAIRILGGEITRVETFSLGAEGERCILTVKKISHTPTKYPRPAAKIKKSPL